MLGAINNTQINMTGIKSRLLIFFFLVFIYFIFSQNSFGEFDACWCLRCWGSKSTTITITKIFQITNIDDDDWQYYRCKVTNVAGCVHLLANAFRVHPVLVVAFANPPILYSGTAIQVAKFNDYDRGFFLTVCFKIGYCVCEWIVSTCRSSHFTSQVYFIQLLFSDYHYHHHHCLVLRMFKQRLLDRIRHIRWTTLTKYCF